MPDGEAFTDMGRSGLSSYHLSLSSHDVNTVPQLLRLRDVDAADLPVLFQQQADPEANRMAMVMPREWGAFSAHWAKILADPSVVAKVIDVDGVVVGQISCFKLDGEDAVGYWIGREHWGKGFVTRALSMLLEQVPVRPLHARVARQNAASLRVLERCGFEVTGYQVSPADERYLECEEALLVLR